MSSVDARERFRPTARAYTKANRLVFSAAMPFWLLCILIMVATHDGSYTFVAMAVFWAVCIVGAVLAPKLTCPVCDQNPEKRPEHFCPECGHTPLSERVNIMGFRRCDHCAKTLRIGKGRPGYTIRFCTHCGTHLTDNGIRSA